MSNKRREIPWFDVIGFFVLLPLMHGGFALYFYLRYRGVGSIHALLLVLIFGVLAIVPLLLSVGVFVAKLAIVVGVLLLAVWVIIESALRETWNEMIDLMVETKV